VTLNDVGGNVKVHTSFASAFVKNVRGAIDIQNQNGAITVNGLAASCHPINLQTTFSSIRVGLPPNVGYDLNARTSFGHITTDIPVTTITQNVGAEDDSLIGRIGNGGCRLEIRTSNGGITIGRE